MYVAGIALRIVAVENVDLLDNTSITCQLVSNIELSSPLARAFGIGEPAGAVIVRRCNAGVTSRLRISHLVVLTLIASCLSGALVRSRVLRSYLVGFGRLSRGLIVSCLLVVRHEFYSFQII